MAEPRSDDAGFEQAGFETGPARLAGFDAYYAREIAPWLAEKEAERRQVRDRVRTRFAGAAGLGLLAVLLFVFAQARDAPWPVAATIVAAVGAFLLFMWGEARLSALRHDLKTGLNTRVFRFFDLHYTPAPGTALLGRVYDARILPSHDRRHVEDGVAGRISGVDFEIAEAHLEDKRTTTDSRGRTRTHYVTVFRGLIGGFAFPKPFHGHTIVAADGGLIGNFFQGLTGGERVRLEDPLFEKAFEVYSTDQVEARYLLTPAFMERLLRLKSLAGGRLQAAFTGNTLYLTVHGVPDRFEAGSFWRDVTLPDQTKRVLAESAIIEDIVTTLKLDQETRA